MNNSKVIKKKRRTVTVTKDRTVTKHFQVQLYREDALKFKNKAAIKGLSLQEGLVKAINLQMKEWGFQTLDDPGTVRPKK